MSNRVYCDVVVVGAGPGGSAAAYWLARAGANVILVDKADFPRNKPCGDGLTPRAVDLLESMGMAEFAKQRGRAFTSVRVSSHDSRQAPPYILRSDRDGHLRRGLVIPRFELDNALRQQAISAGARFLAGFTALEPHHQCGRVAGVYGRHAAGSLAIEASLMIIATGANRKLMEACGLVNDVRPGGLALRTYISGLRDLDETLEVYLDQELLPGYAWVFPTGNETANVGVGITLDGASTAETSRRLRTAFGRLLRNPRLATGHILGRPQGYPIYTDFPAVPVQATGVLVVGETAGLVDPLTGEGIAFALESGQLAAEVACEALACGDVSTRRLSAYEETLRERHGRYFEKACELLARLNHPLVLNAFSQYAQTDSRIREAMRTAIVDEQPQNSISLLSDVLRNSDGAVLAKALYTLNAYKPWLDQCRNYMLTNVRQDTPSSAIVEMLERGKMFRALSVFLGCQAAGGDPAQVLAGAAGIELVHAASLIHDDIMDNAVVRRGLPALYTTLGVSRAIVCGDYLIAKSFRLLAESRTRNPAARVVEAFVIGAESGVLTCVGQFQDVGAWGEMTLDEGAYDQLIIRKTVAAIAGALKAGAALVGGNESLLQALGRYGEYIGRAFQIRDDVLEFTAATDGHILERRLSLPLIHAFRQADEDGRKVIQRFLNEQAVPDDDIVHLVNSTGALVRAQGMAQELADEAVRQARDIPPIAEALEAFAYYAVMREG